MEMAMKRNQLSGSGGKGGGPGSRALTPRVTTYFGGRPSSRVNPGEADQLGQQMSNHVTGDMGGRSTKLPNPATPMIGGSMPGVGATKLGNEVALNVGKGGVGTGRVNYGQSGVQGQHGPVAGSTKPQGREILRDFGPDSPIVSERK
jgi:hypothetical protein